MSKIGERNGTPEEMKERGDALRARIARAGLSFADVGQRAGLSRSQMYRLGKGQIPTEDQKRKLEALLESTG